MHGWLITSWVINRFQKKDHHSGVLSRLRQRKTSLFPPVEGVWIRQWEEHTSLLEIILAILLIWRVKLWTTDTLVLIICDLCFSYYRQIISFQFIATSTFVKERHAYTFKMSLPIVDSNNIHNVSPKCIAGSIWYESSWFFCIGIIGSLQVKVYCRLPQILFRMKYTGCSLTESLKVKKKKRKKKRVLILLISTALLLFFSHLFKRYCRDRYQVSLFVL